MAAAETVLPEKQVQTFEQQVAEIEQRFTELSIENDEAYEQAGALRVFVNGVIKAIEERCRPVKQATHQAHREAVKMEKDLLAKPSKILGQIDDAMLAYHERREAELREQERALAAEAQAQHDEALLEEAAELEAAGQAEAAEAVLAQAGEAASVVKLDGPKFAGGGVRKKWKAEVTDLGAFLASAVTDPGLRAFVKIDTLGLSRHISKLDGHVPKDWKGIGVQEVKTLASKRGNA